MAAKFFTSVNHAHRHSWSHKNKRTSINNGHSHKIGKNKVMALRGKTNHSHKLFK